MSTDEQPQGSTEPNMRKGATKTQRIKQKRAERKKGYEARFEGVLQMIKPKEGSFADSTESKPASKPTIKPTINNEETKDTPSSNKKKQKKRKADNAGIGAEPKAKHAKFSSLFKNNPEIQKIQASTASSHSEEVFSGEDFMEKVLHPFMVSNLKNKMNITKMTSIQQAAIPHILDHKDTLVKSQTGSGKTLAYAVPIVQCMQAFQPKVQRSDGAYAVVIVPTRELVLQVLETFQKLLQPFMWIVPGSIMGGEQRKKEKARLRKGINILVSTPGRLLDHMEKTDNLDMARLKWLVIDEADRLLDMGFEKDIKRFIDELNKKEIVRQTVLVSATLNAGVEKLAGMSLTNPVKVDMSAENNKVLPGGLPGIVKGDVFSLPEGLRHHFIQVPHKLQLVTLAAFLVMRCKRDRGVGKILVFVSTTEMVEFLYVILGEFLATLFEDLSISCLHGDMKQAERTKAFKKFSSATGGVLICTDVAARGLDMPHVQWIVQYTAPASGTDYIHRVGRTARIGTHGQALLFLAPSESGYVNMLREGINVSLKEMLMDKVLSSLIVESATIRRQGKQPPRTIDECATALQMTFEEFIAENGETSIAAKSGKKHHEREDRSKKEGGKKDAGKKESEWKTTRTVARSAYQSFVRAYATYPSALKSIFHVKNLHLGHLAKSFALQDSPKHIGEIIHNHKASFSTKWNKNKNKPQQKKKPRRYGNISEFADGL